jgi:hypothetical protein
MTDDVAAAVDAMQFDWSTLGGRAPAALVKARTLAHHAVQWPARAARANLEAVADDSHSSLTWDGARRALFSRPLAAAGAEVRVGLRLAGLALIVMRNDLVLDTYELAGRRDSMVAVWLDSALRALGLKAASGVTLPYTIPFHVVARGSPYSFSGESESFGELVRWFDAAADLLDEMRMDFAGTLPEPGATMCWPHHFDVAMLVSPHAQADGTARPIGIGFSPGDHDYAQPYVYVSPLPHPDAAGLPALPPPGHWHTHGFVGAVATGEAILALDDRRAGVCAFVRAACEIGGIRLVPEHA